MADLALGSVEKIVKLALAVKEAVETVRQNKKECCDIEKCVARSSALLKRLEQKTEIMKDKVMCDALEDLAESLHEALRLVMECQRRHFLSHLWKAGDMAKELRRVQDDIVCKMQLGNFATNVQTTVILTNIQHAGAPPPPPPPEEVVSGFTRFSFSELKAATSDFSDENIIGEGGSATVYKGVLHDGQVVAVKKLSDKFLSENESSLYDQINIFLELKHKNIVRPLGYCHEVIMVLVRQEGKFVGAKSVQFCFVEEYMPNGRDNNVGSQLIDWSTSFKTILGIAQGVHYLHEQRVVHLDLKPSNILLDSNMNPRITDFGIAKMLDHGVDEIILDNSLLGTPGYMAPEYVGEGILSTKCDVYAFGVTLLGTISGMCRSEPPYLHALAIWAWTARDAEQIEDLYFEPSLCDESQLMEIKRCIEVGLLCVQKDQKERPTMLDVLHMLNGEKELPNPGVSAYLSGPRTSLQDAAFFSSNY